VLPVSVVSSLLGLLVFYGTLLANAALEHADTEPELLAAVPLAQSALVSFLVFCGLLVLVFLKPPTRWWARAAELSTDRRPAILAVTLMVVFVVISAEPALRRLLTGPATAEARARAERLLDRLEADRATPTPQRLRALRAVEALERIGSAEARKLLEELARGADGAELTVDARAAMGRLAHRPPPGE
jgi:hypothetical protein